jgi:hypothetical protein
MTVLGRNGNNAVVDGGFKFNGLPNLTLMLFENAWSLDMSSLS